MAIKDTPVEEMVRVCQLFVQSRLKQLSIAEVARELSRDTGKQYTRVDVNRILAKAFQQRLFVVRPPPNMELEDELYRRYKAPPGSIHVVSAALGGASEAVAADAAHDSLRLIRKLAREKPAGSCVGVGLVGGGTVQRVAQLMADEMRAEPDLPPVVLHAACAGFDPERPETAPVTFLGYFADVPAVRACVALFAMPAVEVADYGRELNTSIPCKSFDRAHEIDLVITSLAAYRDKHNILRDIARLTNTEDDDLADQGIVGDVAYAPYGEYGPLEIKRGYRAVTLFTIPDLVSRSRQRFKEVMLVAGPCRMCEADLVHREQSLRADALHPLMTVAELRAWSQLYIDTTTAAQLANWDESGDVD